MSKSYKVVKKTMNMGEKRGKLFILFVLLVTVL